MNIAVGLSGNYLNHLIVMATSVCENNKRDIDLYALVEEFSEEDKKFYFEKMEKYENLTTHFIDISKEDVKGFPLTQYFKISTFFRVLLATKLSEDVKKILYLDVDLIVDNCLDELWDVEVDSAHPIAAVKEESLRKYNNRLSIPDEYSYVNAGVLLLNMEEIRKQNLFEKVKDYIHDNAEHLMWLDQDALNASLYDKIKYVNNKWNYHNYFIVERKSDKKIILELDNPHIVHYTGPVKPWNDEEYSALGYLYGKYNKIAFGEKGETKKEVEEVVEEKKATATISTSKKIIKKIYQRARVSKLYRVYEKNSHKFIGLHCWLLKKRNSSITESEEIIGSYLGKEVKDLDVNLQRRHFTRDILGIYQDSKYIGFEGFGFDKEKQTEEVYLYAKNAKTGDVKILSTTKILYPSLNYEIDGEKIPQYSSGFKVYLKKADLDHYEYEFGIIIKVAGEYLCSGELQKFYIGENYSKPKKNDNPSKVKIYTMHFGKYFTFANDVFVPLQLSAENAKVKLDMIGDNTGDNISTRNDLYCELTGLYWAWKNDLESEYLGLAHYRRFLIPKVLNPELPLDKNLKHNSKLIKDLTEHYDVILPKMSILPCTMRENYAKEHNVADFDVMFDVINEKFSFLNESAELASKSRGMYLANLGVMKREIFNEYCEILFSVLEEVEKRIEIPEDSYDKRVLGFLAERLTTIYAYYLYSQKKYKIAEVDILNTDSYYKLDSSRLLKKKLDYVPSTRKLDAEVLQMAVYNDALVLYFISKLVGVDRTAQKSYLVLHNSKDRFVFHLDELDIPVYEDYEFAFDVYERSEVQKTVAVINPRVAVKPGNYAMTVITHNVETDEYSERYIYMEDIFQ